MPREYLEIYKRMEKITERMGIWMDMDHPYVTCDNDYIESLWWILKQLFNQNLSIKDIGFALLFTMWDFSFQS